MITVILLALLGLPLYVGLFGDHLVVGHDALAGLVRVICMDKFWGDGQFLPRWLPDINFGFGSPMFNFYPPFFYVMSILFSKVTGNLLIAMNLVCVFLWILSGVGMFFLAREFWGHKGGIISAVAYMYAPYHIQDLYVRGAFAEFSAFAFFPLIILSFYKINQRADLRYILLGVFSVFSLSLTHNVMNMLFFPVIIMYILIFSLIKRDIKIFLLEVSIVIVALMMSAFFWLPAFDEKSSLNLLLLFFLHYEFHQHFLSFVQLFNVPWGINPDDAKVLPYHIGIFPVILALVFLGVILKKFREDKRLCLNYLFFLIVGIVAICFTLPLSSVIWDKIILLRCVQFPWRLLAIISFCVSLLAGGIMMLSKSKSLMNVIFIGSIILLMLSSLKLITSIGFRNVDQVEIKNNLSDRTSLGEGEYTPRWILKVPTSKLPQKFSLMQGNGGFAGYKMISPVEHSIKVMAYEPLRLCFSAFYFPGWKVFIDEKPTEIQPESQYGLISFLVPPGEHTVRVVFGSTPIRNTAVIISGIGLIFFILGVFFVRKLVPRPL